MQKGNSKETLLDTVRKLDETTALDSLFNRGQIIHVLARKEQGKLRNWKFKNKSYKNIQHFLDSFNEPFQLQIKGSFHTTVSSWELEVRDEVYTDKNYLSLDSAVKELSKKYVGEDFSLVLKGEKTPNTIDYWQLIEESEFYKKPKPIALGRGSDSLISTLAELNETQNTDENIHVLCLQESGTHRTWNGMIQTTWVRIDPTYPSIIENGKLSFPSIQFLLSEDEYAVCLECGIAFYHVATEVVYPIRKVACKSIGVLLDCSGALRSKYLEDASLGTAILLANRLLECETLQFIYRYRTERIRPLIGLGKAYQKYSQVDFFKEALEYCQKQGICTISKWSVSDEKTVVNILIGNVNTLYSPLIRIEFSDIPGYGIILTTFIRIGKGLLMIRSNRILNTKEMQINNLYAGVFEAIQDFQTNFIKMQMLDIQYDKALLLPILKVLGKKRSKDIKKIPEGSYNASQLLQIIIDRTYTATPESLGNRLSYIYANVFNELIGKPIIRVKIKKEV